MCLSFKVIVEQFAENQFLYEGTNTGKNHITGKGCQMLAHTSWNEIQKCGVGIISLIKVAMRSKKKGARDWPKHHGFCFNKFGFVYIK